jgi:ribosome modulation factor
MNLIAVEENMPRVVIDADEAYPVYFIKRVFTRNENWKTLLPEHKVSINIPPKKLAWIKNTEKEFRKVQDYLERMHERAYNDFSKTAERDELVEWDTGVTEGYNAFGRVPITKCPYPVATLKRYAWLTGWRKHHSERVTTTSGRG